MTETTVLNMPAHDAGMKADAQFLGRWMLIGAGSGALSGALIGGVGGRLAMFVLRLTSSDSLRGLQTDDGFEIGVVTFATVELIILTTIIGAVGGLVYVVFRGFVADRWRVAAWALACATVGGSLMITTDGIDFRFLDPLWLAVVMFIAIPAAGGAWTAYLVEQGRRSSRKVDWRLIVGAVSLIPMLFGPILIIGPVFLAVLGAGRVVQLRAGATQWWGRAIALTVYTVLVALSSSALFDDVTTIL